MCGFGRDLRDLFGADISSSETDAVAQISVLLFRLPRLAGTHLGECLLCVRLRFAAEGSGRNLQLLRRGKVIESVGRDAALNL